MAMDERSRWLKGISKVEIRGHMMGCYGGYGEGRVRVGFFGFFLESLSRSALTLWATAARSKGADFRGGG